MDRNLFNVYLFVFFRKFVLYMSILPVIYLRYGMSIIQISTITIIAQLTIFLFEVPTGTVADKVGKKKSVVYGVLIECIGIIYILTSTKCFADFIIWVVIQGIGVTLISGADKALVFEYLKSRSSEGQFHRLSGNISFLERLSTFIATLVCGVILEVSFDMVLVVTLVFKIFALIMILMFKDDHRSEYIHRSGRRLYKAQLKYAYSFIKSNKKYLYYMLFQVLLLNATGILWEYRSLIVSDKTGMSISRVSIVVAILNLIFAISFLLSSIFKKLLDKDKYNAIYILIPFFMILTCLIPNYLSIITFVLFVMMNAIMAPFIDYRLNTTIQDDSCRATLLSVNSAIESIVYMIMVGVFAGCNKITSFNVSFIILGIIFFLFYLLIEWGSIIEKK